ncbi:MAG: gamma-glutamyltransferase [Hyphomicrobiaceae bacterium]
MKKPKGIVAAGHEVTAAAAAEMLEDGGNAFDAVVAGLFTACVPEVVLSSPGGGGFLMAHVAAKNSNILYDFFAETPRVKRPESEIDFRAIEADFGPATQEFHIGAGSAATPGFVPGLSIIHQDLCRLPWVRLLEPAVEAARSGVEMTEFHAYLFTVIAPILRASDAATRTFAPVDDLLKAGEIFRNEALADAFDAMANEDARLFTEGEVGRAMVRQSEEQGGHLSMDDLAKYEVIRRQPIVQSYKKSKLFLNPPPAASGPLIAFGLALADKLAAHHSIDPVGLTDVMRQTNEARANLGDDAEKLTDDATITSYFKALAGTHLVTRGTTHISAIDADGNAAAATISNGEGNGLMVDGCGFMLNNMLGEEDLNPAGFHSWPQGERLSSMMAPTLIEEQNGTITAMGSGGSNRIRTAILQVALNLLERGMSLEDAVYAPRIHLEKCGTLSMEDDFAEQERQAIMTAFPEAKVWPERNMFFGGVHTARRTASGQFEGAGDARRGGVVIAV